MEEIKRGPGRPPRSDAMKAERRRRNTEALSGKRRRLPVATEKLDRDNYEYRWVNDAGGRLYQLTQLDDWDVVQDRDGDLAPKNDSQGAEVAHLAGVGDRGEPVRAVLLRKPKSLHDDDKRAKLSRIDVMEAALKAGNNPDGSKAEQSYPSNISFRRD